MILFTDSEGPDQTARMRKLIWAFAARICPKTRFRLARPTCYGSYNYIFFFLFNAHARLMGPNENVICCSFIIIPKLTIILFRHVTSCILVFCRGMETYSVYLKDKKLPTFARLFPVTASKSGQQYSVARAYTGRK